MDQLYLGPLPRADRRKSPTNLAKMRLFSAFTIFATFLLPLVASESGKQQVAVYAWPIAESKPQVLAEVTYDPKSLTASVKKYHGLSPTVTQDLVRVGLYDSKTKDWTGIVTSGSQFKNGGMKTLTLHLDHDGNPFYVGFGATTTSKDRQDSGKKSGGSEGLKVIVKPPVQGPQPHLNKPVVLNADGKADEKEPEKSFIQKCALQCEYLKPFRC